jgi:hypothetical protein
MNLIHTFPPYFSKLLSNIFPPIYACVLQSILFPSDFPTELFVCISSLSFLLYFCPLIFLCLLSLLFFISCQTFLFLNNKATPANIFASPFILTPFHGLCFNMGPLGETLCSLFPALTSGTYLSMITEFFRAIFLAFT